MNTVSPRPSPLVVESLPSLLELYREVASVAPRRYSGVRLVFPALAAEENERLQRRYNGLYLACGCVEGMVLAAAFVVAYWVWTLQASEVGWSDGVWTAVGFLVFGALGKTIGKRLARGRLRREVVQLRGRLEPAGQPRGSSPAVATCG